MSTLLRLHRRHFSTSPSSILSPSDPSAVLTSKQKSLATLALLKQIPRDPSPSSIKRRAWMKMKSYVVGSLPTTIYIPNFITQSEQAHLLHQVLEVSRQALMGEELTKNHGFVSGSKSNEEEEEEVEKAMRQM